MSNTIKVRRGVIGSLPTLEAGELAVTTDTHQAFFGDGVDNHEIAVYSSGTLNATTGFRVNNAAPSGSILIGNGTNYVTSTITIPNTIPSGSILAVNSNGSAIVPVTGPDIVTPDTYLLGITNGIMSWEYQNNQPGITPWYEEFSYYDTNDFDNVSGNLTIKNSGIDHDATTNFVANEHINHTSVSLLNGNGISCSGDITANRTIGLTTLTSDWDIGDGRMIQADKIRARDADGLSLFEDGGAGIFVKDGGNVGIGTTAPECVLDLGDTFSTRKLALFSNPGQVNFYGFGIESTGLMHFQTNSVTSMVIDVSGNVGIGTIAPSAKLAINGGLHVGGDSDPGDNNLLVDGSVEIDGALNHDGTTVGFYGVVPVVKGAGLTAQLTTITHTAPGTPDYALQDLVQNTGFGFATKDEGNSLLAVIANLQGRVVELETRLGSSTGVGLFT